MFQPSVGSENRFAASVTVDEELLHIAPTQLIYPEECTRIYGYTRAEDMVRKYELGKVIGAGSFGVVREATVRSSGEKVARFTSPAYPANRYLTMFPAKI